ncbi:MAG: hypothetical protein CL512_04995 [Actinobacteria bacterium]|nr:hypothetical protein [Actinomycetota bacterium]|tara:strand:+ start:228 stop:1226 length:999 start_codon:yes stop_codon:yes gene_type:complete
MPQVFKSRRNILRAANKSKREHFTQQEENSLETLNDRIRQLYKDISDLTAAKKKLDNAETAERNAVMGDFLGELVNATLSAKKNLASLQNDKITNNGISSVVSWRDLDKAKDSDDLEKKNKEIVKKLNDKIDEAKQRKGILEQTEGENVDQFGELLSKIADAEKAYNNALSNYNTNKRDLEELERDERWTSLSVDAGLEEHLETLRNKYDFLDTDDDISTIKSKLNDKIDEVTNDAANAEAEAKSAKTLLDALYFQLDDMNSLIVMSQSDTIKFKQEWGSLIGTGSEGIQTCEQLNKARNLLKLGSAPYCGESFQQEPKEFPNSKKKKDEDF